MTSKERVLTAFARQEPDRVPINYSANLGIDRRLKDHFGLAPDDREGIRKALGVDFQQLAAPYIGPKLHADLPDRQVDMWGIRRRWIEHDSGGYWDYCDFPLRYATVEQVEAWPMPSPDDFDYSQIAAECKRLKEFCVYIGSAGLGDIINSTGMLRTMEQTLMDLATDDPAAIRLIERKAAIMLEVTRRTLEAARGGVDLLWMGEDLGTQRGQTISLELFRRRIRPVHQQFVDLAKEWKIPVAIHSCGSSSWAFDDLADMGVNVVDTLQPEAKDMAPEYLKKRFGDRLAFHGMISTAGPVAYGTVDDVVRNVTETLETMMPGGGYALAPTHSLQDNSPTENVLAMYDTARKVGWYR